MIQELKQHFGAYTVLILGLLIFVTAFFFVWPDHMAQRTLSIGVGLFYFIWGITTHVKVKHLSSHVFFEYFTVAVLASFLLLMVTF